MFPMLLTSSTLAFITRLLPSSNFSIETPNIPLDTGLDFNLSESLQDCSHSLSHQRRVY